MQHISNGFSQPVQHAQQCFRQILKALSEPGTKVTLQHHAGFAPLNAAASQILLSLCDQDTSLYLSPELTTTESDLSSAWQNLAFHNGIKASNAELADFVVLNQQCNIKLNQLKAGTELSPEQSATVIVQSNSFSSGPRLKLSGPGIADSRELQLGELNEGLLNYLVKPSQRFPLGLDFMFCHQDSLIAVSRTTQLELS
ncbi:phosphonate C-P lyase system protein PhnH [Agarivorans gilvus]|uniref:Carbon-phosphorus lyase subunit PhnH n=1 Tax=Agarivorans gilvus TaxID=680279 RepID=A0ABQ1I0V9_9ALTE|nr:phosphonate C-P lyase system protein PhnH [Agarivorans gilvus]GGB00864.1 carbon-phosphorus lyase subunit PhnH [Agarivorans gilvus]